MRANDYALDHAVSILLRGNLESGDRLHRAATESACVARFFYVERIRTECRFEIAELSAVTITIALIHDGSHK